MRLIPWCAGLFASAFVLSLLPACEKHHLGEYPEVQRDRLAEARAERGQRGNTHAPEGTPTPANFFPETKSP